MKIPLTYAAVKTATRKLPAFVTVTLICVTAQSSQKMSDAPTGTVQKMIVENGSVTLDFDLNGLNGSSSLVARPVTLHFTAAANSFLPFVVFNDLLRAAETGSISLIPQNAAGAEVDVLGYSTLISTADAWLCQHPIGSGVTSNSPAWRQINASYNTLTSYNEGKLCAPKCRS